jgi:hypothetical protein
MERAFQVFIYWILQTAIWFTLWGFMIWYNWAFYGFPTLDVLFNRDFGPYSLTWGIYTIIMSAGYLGYFVLLLGVFVDAELIEEKSKKLRKEKRKVLKLKLEVKVLETKKERLEKTKELKQEQSTLQCQIKQLQKPANAFKTCAKCGKKVPLASCFCSECGGKL